MAKKNEFAHLKLWDVNPAWETLTDDEKVFIEGNSKIYSFRKNEIIHKEGDTPTHMMMLVSGKARVYKEGVGNRIQIVRMLNAGGFFGYRSMIANENYNTTVSATEESHVYFIKRDAFMRIIKENGHFCYLFLESIAKDLGNSDRRTVNLAQKHIRGRLAESLLYLIENYGLDEDGATISIYVSREDLANLSNMTTSNAIRTLSAFEDEGIISVDGRKYKILDMNELVRTSRMG